MEVHGAYILPAIQYIHYQLYFSFLAHLCFSLIICSLCPVLEAVVSPVVFPKLLPDGQLSRAPLSEAGTASDFSPELSLPQSPQLKSTAREQSRYRLTRLQQGRCNIRPLFNGVEY